MANSMTKKCMTPEFFNCYSMAQFVTDETHVLLNDGTILQGKEEIIAGLQVLPDELQVMAAAGPNKYMLVAADAEFFLDSCYKKVLFR